MTNKLHQEIINSSLETSYKYLKKTGTVKVRNLYFLNILFNILNDEELDLSISEKQNILNIYKNTYLQNEEICKISENLPIYPIINNFEQADYNDCVEFNDFDKIYYWQYNQFIKTFQSIKDDVITTDFFNDKLYKTYVEFNNGVNIEYSNIGKICFALFSPSSNTYIIEDILGNNVTSQFDTQFIQSHNVLLFASKNIYSHGNIHFKIKIAQPITNVFNNIFNNVFN